MSSKPKDLVELLSSEPASDCQHPTKLREFLLRERLRIWGVTKAGEEIAELVIECENCERVSPWDGN